MSNVLFQRPTGTAWDFKWTDSFSTLVQKAAAPGFETRVSLGPDPIRMLELNYAILYAGARGQTRDQLLGFFNQRGGDFDSFLVDLGSLTTNTADSSVTGQVLTPDASSVAPIVLAHYVSAAENWNENIYELAGVNGNPGSAPVIKLDGTPLVEGTDYNIQGPGYSESGVTYPGLVVVLIASLGSPAGVVTADFSWYYRVRFAQPQLEADMFYFLLWKAQQIQLIQTRN